MLFFVQINFSESKDILPKLPGDILVVFISDESCIASPPQYHLEWVNIGDEPLCSPDMVVYPPWEFGGCWGFRYRTIDYLDIKQIARKTLDHYPNNSKLETLNWQKLGVIARLPASLKIAGMPSWLEIDRKLENLAKGQRLLCSIGTIQVSGEYPWANRREPYPFSYITDDFANLTGGWDSFFCWVFIDENGTLSVVARAC